jgi:hypothetical protein
MFQRIFYFFILEEIAAVNLAKYRKAQTDLGKLFRIYMRSKKYIILSFTEDSAERADVAENQLSKLRAKNRSTVSANRSTVSELSLKIKLVNVMLAFSRTITVRQRPHEVPLWFAVVLFVHVKTLTV